MAFIAPIYSRRQVDVAGQEIRNGRKNLESYLALGNWRSSHLYIINTFQANLRGRRKNFNSDVVIAQRLKRIPTIVDKLKREPGMSLSRMHDIAGCRLIFNDVKALQQFRSEVHTSKAKHVNVTEDDRYNYITNPKSSGYRGVHDIYKYVAYSKSAEKWNNLRIELQYRTKVQHAWATAVEIVDLVNSKRLKFGQADADLTRQFLLASDILSRYHEGMFGYCGDKNNQEIIDEFFHIESNTHALARLKGVTSSKFNKVAQSAKLFVLVNFYDPESEIPFEAFPYYDNRSAAEGYIRLEQEYQDRADVVLVGATDQDAVRLAYTNYLYDASIFIDLFEEAVSGLV